MHAKPNTTNDSNSYSCSSIFVCAFMGFVAGGGIILLVILFGLFN